MQTPKRVLITGVTGSAGSYLAEYILKKYPTVRVGGISRKNCDLTDYKRVHRNLRKVVPDVIFHLASNADVRASFDAPLSHLYNNIMGTCVLFQTIKELHIRPTVVHCSTSEVYGQVTEAMVPINEDCPINPVSPYAISKTTQDMLAKMYHQSYGLKIIRTRMFAYINPRRTNLFASSFAMQIARIEAGKQDTLTHGNLQSVRTMIDVRDAMEAYWLAALLCTPGEAYNIGGGVPITVGDFLELLISKAKAPITKRLDKTLLRPTDVTLQIPNTTKFEAATGWKPKISYEESVDWLLEECRRKV